MQANRKCVAVVPKVLPFGTPTHGQIAASVIVSLQQGEFNNMAAQIWPVIHLSTMDQALENADIAARCDATGVFVIHMDGRDDEVDPAAFAIKQRFPQLKVGVNYLSLPAPVAAVRSIALGMDATWADQPGIRSDKMEAAVDRALVPALRQNPAHQFFASVAFKYQPVEPDPGVAAKKALGRGLIPTTSGDATGIAPEVAKLYGIRRVIGRESPLAIASGVSTDNAYELSRFASHILVSTGISKSFHEFDEHLLRRLVEQVSD